MCIVFVDFKVSLSGGVVNYSLMIAGNIYKIYTSDVDIFLYY